MWPFFVLLNIILCPLVISKRKNTGTGDDLGAGLITALRNDANLDLPADEEYEDLRAELLAYHTALASITSGRRSMKTTPCWQLGGICVHNKMCKGHRFLTEVPGCKNNLEVCCFTWNKFQVRDFRDKGIDVAAMPWSGHKEFGGKGIMDPFGSSEKKKKKHYYNDNNDVEHHPPYDHSPHDHSPHDHSPHDHPPHDHPPHDHPPHDHASHDHPPHDHLSHDHPPHDHQPHDRPPHDHPHHEHSRHDQPYHEEAHPQQLNNKQLRYERSHNNAPIVVILKTNNK